MFDLGPQVVVLEVLENRGVLQVTIQWVEIRFLFVSHPLWRGRPLESSAHVPSCCK